MAESLRIGVIDDHPIFREGVIAALEAAPQIKIVGAGASAADAVHIAQQELPDIMLLDINIPGSGIEATRKIARTCRRVKVVILTGSECIDDLTAALEAGALGYLLKGVRCSDLVPALLAVHNGECYITPTLGVRALSCMQQRSQQPKIAVSKTVADLTFREEQILIPISSGATTREIAQKLKLSEETIRHYVANILRKLQVRNRVQAALAFQKQRAEVR